MNAVRKTIASFLILLLITSAISVPAAASTVELDLTAKSAILIEAESGKILYTKNAEEKMAPASLTKIMTLLVAMEELDRGRVDWDTMITTSQRAWSVSEGGRTSTMFLNINQEATFEDMIKGIAIVSANDACIAIAEHLFGSEDTFVQKMNQRAAELGLENTNFANSHGLDHPDQYITALDMARLAAYFIKTQPETAAYQTERSFTFNNIRQETLNPLILNSFPGADGVKTGSTGAAGMSLVGTAKRDGLRLVSVVLNTPSQRARGQDSEVLLNYGFSNFEMLTLYEAGEVAAYTSVSRGQENEVGLVAKTDIGAIVPRGEADYIAEERLMLDRELAAPVEEGAKVGVLQLLNSDGEILREVELFAAESVERLGFFRSIFRTIGEFFSSLWAQGRGRVEDAFGR